MRQVAEQTGNRIRLGPRTLYSSIRSLLENGLIEELDSREDAASATSNSLTTSKCLSATLVGETPACATHSGVRHRLHDHFGMGVPETVPSIPTPPAPGPKSAPNRV
jgi:hypothetical protein